MKSLMLILVLGALVGCGGGGDGGGGGKFTDQVMARMQTTRDQACACKEAACAEKARTEFMDWGKANLDRMKKEGDPPREFQEKFMKLSKEADACIDALREAADVNGPPPVPVAPTPPEAAPPPDL